MPRHADGDPVPLPTRIPQRQMNPVMSLAEARAVLRVRRAVLLELVRDGSLRTFKRGKNVYCSDTALRAAIEVMEKRFAQSPSAAVV